MTRRRPRLFETTPNRGATAFEIATYLGLTETALSEKLDELAAAGFPFPDPLTGRYDVKAIDLWLDCRSGIAESVGALGADNDHKGRLAKWRRFA